MQLGVTAPFQDGVSVEKVLQSLREMGPQGGEWLEELEISRDPWFNVNVGDGFYHYHRSWNDDLSMPFSALPSYIRQVQAGESLERPVEKLQAERRS